MDFIWFFCAVFSGISMIMDIKWEKVFNFWIVTGLAASFVFCLKGEEGTGYVRFASGAFMPVVLLFPLFVGKMLGTGDIKVFAVIGSLMGPRQGLECMAWAFAAGAVIAVPVLLIRCDVRERFTYFFNYLNHIFITKTFPPYLVPGKRPENIHFTIPIFCSVVLMIVKGEIA